MREDPSMEHAAATGWREDGSALSTIEAVTAIKLADRPCCIEILVAHVDHSLPKDAEFAGIIVFPDEHGVITLDVGEARALRARLDVAIRALEQRGLSEERASQDAPDRAPGRSQVRPLRRR